MDSNTYNSPNCKSLVRIINDWNSVLHNLPFGKTEIKIDSTKKTGEPNTTYIKKSFYEMQKPFEID